MNIHVFYIWMNVSKIQKMAWWRQGLFQQTCKIVPCIHAINHLTSGLFTVNAMLIHWNILVQNVNNQSFKHVLQLYVDVSLCLNVIRSWLHLLNGGHGFVFCIPGTGHINRSYTTETFSTATLEEKYAT